MNNDLQAPLLDKGLDAEAETTFEVSKEDLSDLFVQDNIRGGQSLGNLKGYEDVQGLAKKLRVDLSTGLSTENEHDMQLRVARYGDNAKIEKPAKGLCHYICEQLEDTILRILIVAAIISLVIGMIMHPDHGWIEGTAILSAVVIVVGVGSGNDYVKEKQFRALFAQCEERTISVIRDGEPREVSIYKLLVGDIVEIKTGEKLPVDGILINASSMLADESALTGEPDAVKKTAGVEQGSEPFLLSGCKITEGRGRMIVAAVGPESFQGRSQKLLQVEETGPTPLQAKLERVAEHIGTIGCVAALITVIALVSRYSINKYNNDKDWGQADAPVILEYLIIGITVIVVAVPEGLPLAVTLCLAFSVGKMRAENNLVRHLAACETMGGANNICSDKTGTLTENQMTVVKAYVSPSYFEKEFQPSDVNWRNVKDELINGICVNSDGHLQEEPGQVKKEQIGNRTDCALLGFAEVFGVEYKKVRGELEKEILKQLPFSSKTKKMSTVVRQNGKVVVHSKGAAEIMLAACTQIKDCEGNVRPLEESEKDMIKAEVIHGYATQALRNVAICNKELDSEVLPGDEELESGLTLVAIVGIQDPVRGGVPEIIKLVTKESGITVRMVTGDAKDTAVAIARNCNIIGNDTRPGEVLEGKEFREQVGGLVYDPDDKEKAFPKVKNLEVMKKMQSDLKVLARSSPDDKFLLVTGLMQLGDIVAVTGDGTNDAPALKKSNVGFAMNLAGTEVAKEASDILMVDDNFACIVTAVKWGRNIYDNIRKFVQFQLTVNIVALFVTFAGAVIFEEAPLTAVQMLWVNLIMDSFAALALATEPPSDELLYRQPYKKDEYIITAAMWKTIIGAAIYQISILMTLLFLGDEVFGVPPIADVGVKWTFENGKLLTIVFNTFVFMQVFNEINCRKLKSSELNVFKGFFNNCIFQLIVWGTFGAQILIVQFGGMALRTSPLTPEQHGYCIAIGAGSLIWGFFIRLVPDACCKCLATKQELEGSQAANTKLMRSIRRTPPSTYRVKTGAGGSSLDVVQPEKKMKGSSQGFNSHKN